MIELSWGSIDEQYKPMRDKVMTWAVNKAEEGGPVPMEVGGVVPEEGWRMVDEWDVEGKGEEWEEGEIGAVYPHTRCCYYQGFGQMARECPNKGKRKGGMKGGGKGMTKC